MGDETSKYPSVDKESVASRAESPRELTSLPHATRRCKACKYLWRLRLRSLGFGFRPLAPPEETLDFKVALSETIESMLSSLGLDRELSQNYHEAILSRDGYDPGPTLQDRPKWALSEYPKIHAAVLASNVTTAIGAFLFLASIVQLGSRTESEWPLWSQAFFAVSIPAIAVGARFLGSTQDIRSQRERTRSERENVISAAHLFLRDASFYNESIRADAQAESAKAIREALGPIGMLPFPTSIRGLMAFKDSQIINTQTYQQVYRMLRGNRSISIGVVGRRGTGKSTLLRRIQHDWDTFGSRTVFITVPAAFDAMTFLRILAVEITESVISHQATTRFGSSFRVFHRVWTSGSILMGLIGIALVSEKLLDLSPGLHRLSLSAQGILNIAVTPILAGVIMLFLGVLGVVIGSPFLRRIQRGLSARQRRRRRVRLRRTARSLNSYLTGWHESERSAGFKGNPGIFEVAIGSTKVPVRHPDSYADLVICLRSVLEEYSSSSREDQLTVLVDELDKVEPPEMRELVINTLKDVFHIDGVRFVVTLNASDRDLFWSRRNADAKAFDTAFDEVVTMDTLSARESCDLLESRLPGFPNAVALLCHAWSGGHPRDLVRMARRCADQRAALEPGAGVAATPAFIIQDDLAEICRMEVDSKIVSDLRQLGAELKVIFELDWATEDQWDHASVHSVAVADEFAERVRAAWSR